MTGSWLSRLSGAVVALRTQGTLRSAASLVSAAALICLVQVSPAAGLSPRAFADGGTEKPAKSVEPADVYFGDARGEWTKPAQIDADAVFAETEEYKKIIADKVDKSDANYDILMSKATRRFRAAIRAAAKDGDYDLVAKIGAVKGVDSVPTITQAVIGKL